MAMSRRRLGHYVSFFGGGIEALGLKTLLKETWQGMTRPENTTHPFLCAALARYSEQALLTRGMAVVLHKH